jgi:hypothetical protein
VQIALDHYARAAAHAGRGHIAEAQKEAAAMQEAAAGIPKDVMLGLVNPAAAVLDVAREDLSARVAIREGRHATPLLSRAVAAEDKPAYNEPADWLLPTREHLGAVLMRAGRAADAEKEFRADLERNCQNPRSLSGVWKALERQQKTAQAAEARTTSESASQGADVQLSDALFRVRW